MYFKKLDELKLSTILSQEIGSEKKEKYGLKGVEFKHPVDIGDDWKLVGCYECHNGLNP